MRPSVMMGPGDVRFRSTHTIVQRNLIGLTFSCPSSTEKYLLFHQADTASSTLETLQKVNRKFVVMTDFAAFKLAMKKGRPGEGYLLSASAPSIQEFFQTLSDLSGKLNNPLIHTE